MKFLKEMLGCNVSLMDGENFVFELIRPLAVYPHVRHVHALKRWGTGNATLVAYEKKPVRVDGFEHYSRHRCKHIRGRVGSPPRCRAESTTAG